MDFVIVLLLAVGFMVALFWLLDVLFCVNECVSEIAGLCRQWRIAPG